MQPFRDIDVLDFTQSIAGPTATQLLGTLGAEVVKVEPPTGDHFRDLLSGSMFTSANLGEKRSIALDLKVENGQEVARDLAEQADVVVESFRPGVMEEFDLDYETVSATNENVVYCSITGFGQEGPYADWPAFDPIIQAMSSLMSTIGYPDRPPVRIGTSAIDWSTGAVSSFAIVSALFERQRTNESVYLDVAMLDVALAWMGYWIAHYGGTGEVVSRSGQGFEGLAPNSVFSAADGESFYLAVSNDKLFERLCSVINREDLSTDRRFATNENRLKHEAELREELEATFTQVKRSDLVRRLAEAGVPSGPLRSVDEVVESDPYIEKRDVLIDAFNLELGDRVQTTGLPFRTQDGRGDPGNSPPKLSEHARPILEELGYSEERIERLFLTGAIHGQ